MTVHEVAKRLKVGEDTVVKWETGEKHPTLKRLEQLSKIYKRPLAAFFLPEPPEEPPFPKDFRTLPAEKRASFSPKTRLAIRRARRVRSLVIELAKTLNREVAPKIGRANLLDNPESVAMKARTRLGVEIQTQFAWKDENQALNEWKRAVESLGVMVFQLGVPLGETRGFSLTDGEVPVIVLNLRDAVNARIFSLFHEYAHLLLSDGGICDMEDRDGLSDETKSIEKFCNHFAGALLVPKDALLDRIKPQGVTSKWSDEILKQLAKSFKVSQEVILRRLVILGLATRDFYKRKHEEWQVKAEEWQRRQGIYKLNLPQKCIRENGTPFVSLVLDAHKQGRITYSDVADYLAIRLKYLNQIERLITSKG